MNSRFVTVNKYVGYINTWGMYCAIYLYDVQCRPPIANGTMLSSMGFCYKNVKYGVWHNLVLRDSKIVEIYCNSNTLGNKAPVIFYKNKLSFEI
jgi:hypothetical protein